MWSTWLVIICCGSAISQSATKSISMQEEIQRFLAGNGFKYVSLIENSTTPSFTMTKMTLAIAKSVTSYMKTLTMNEYLKKYTFKFLDLQVFILDFGRDDINTFLRAITQAPVMSSVIWIKSIWTNSEETTFKMLLSELENYSLFYVVVSTEHGVKWYQVITLKSGYAMTELKFFEGTFKLIEDYDMNGLTIYSISLNFAPYIVLKDCDQGGKKCKGYGYLKDYADLIAQKLNFTYDTHNQVDGDWGTMPKSGPYNRSGTWGGVMGAVVNSKYDVSIGSWWMIRERYELLSFATIFSSKEILVWTPTNQIDFGLFVRPFSPESWLAITSLIAIISTCLCMTQYVVHTYYVPFTEDTNGQKIMETILWFFFVLLYAFYGGAMTMFFTNAKQINFQDTVDVIRAYPDWKLVIMIGAKSKIALKATHDPDYANFWARIESSPEETTFYSIEQGLNRIANKKAVMLTSKEVIMGYLVENPTHVHRLETLVTEKNILKCIIFPFNSPLRHMFDKAIMQARESGVEINLIKKWMGAKLDNDGMVENAKLSVQQLILGFVGITFAISTCFVIFCAELIIGRRRQTTSDHNVKTFKAIEALRKELLELEKQIHM
jgi:hypothetical protein